MVCIFSKSGRCDSSYGDHYIKCNGTDIPDNCPYGQSENSNHNFGIPLKEKKKIQKKKPYRVIIRCAKKNTIKKAVEKLIKEFEGDEEIRISKIHRG